MSCRQPGFCTSQFELATRNCMVLTRLCGPLSRGNGWQRCCIVSCKLLTRRALSSAPWNSADEKSTSPTEPSKRKGRTSTKRFTELPNAYLDATGVAAAPLPEWNSYYVSTAPDPVPESEEPPLKAVRKRRSKKINEDVPEEKKGKVLASVSKAPKPTTFLSREILANLKRFPHCLLLTRVGQFYESYFDQAVEIARLLNIKRTSRKWNGQRVAMCGFPIMHLDKHLKTLVQQEQRFVAMCEEYPRYSGSGIKEFDRRISRVITPGTLIDESFLNPLENNYLLAISPSSTGSLTDAVGLAWIDVSTGEFFSKQCILESIPDELARLSPRETLLDKSFQEHKNHPLFSMLPENGCLVSYTSAADLKVGTAPTLLHGDTAGQPTTELDPTDGLNARAKSIQALIEFELLDELDSMPDQETSAIKLLTKFLQDNLLEHMPVLTAPRHEAEQERMQIDAHTIHGLEIRETGHEGSLKGSLLSVIKRTQTSGGARLLARWLCSPSTSVKEINARQSLVGFFHKRAHFRADMGEILKEVDDVGRLCQRFLLGRADFGDLVAINATIGTWSSLRTTCEHEKAMEVAEKRLMSYQEEWNSVDNLFARMTDLTQLSEKISKAVIFNANDPTETSVDDEDTSDTVGEEGASDKINKRWSINPNFSTKLSNIHSALQELTQRKESLEKDLQSRFNAPSLTLRSAPGQGMFIHLARAKRDRAKVDLDSLFYSIGESMSTKSYYYKDWTQLGNKIVETTTALNAAEKEVFELLRLEVIEHSNQLRQNAQIIDELDVSVSFALLAVEMNFIKPEIVEDDSYSVVNGRHPSVEIGLLSSGRQFTPNSVEMTRSSNLHIITGPNMAGKSTLLRQTALIAILAQVGSFVPADHARIGIVDKLFSRIGAKDDLFRDRSTFMVEMLETADILRRATDRSLVIMDEVGRGTTVRDGLAIAFAALHHLVTINRSRCLFATHFHELAEMLGTVDNISGSGIFHNVRFYCSDVDEVGDDHFAYSYRLNPGINRDSHGLKVARLAGVPASAMTVATNTLTWLRQNGTDRIREEHNNFLNSSLRSTS